MSLDVQTSQRRSESSAPLPTARGASSSAPAAIASESAPARRDGDLGEPIRIGLGAVAVGLGAILGGVGAVLRAVGGILEGVVFILRAVARLLRGVAAPIALAGAILERLAPRESEVTEERNRP